MNIYWRGHWGGQLRGLTFNYIWIWLWLITYTWFDGDRPRDFSISFHPDGG